MILLLLNILSSHFCYQQMYTEARTYVIIEITLNKPLVPTRSPEELAKRYVFSRVLLHITLLYCITISVQKQIIIQHYLQTELTV